MNCRRLYKRSGRDQGLLIHLCNSVGNPLPIPHGLRNWRWSQRVPELWCPFGPGCLLRYFVSFLVAAGVTLLLRALQSSGLHVHSSCVTTMESFGIWFSHSPTQQWANACFELSRHHISLVIAAGKANNWICICRGHRTSVINSYSSLN